MNGEKRFAPKTSNGIRKRTPMCRGLTNRTSEGHALSSTSSAPDRVADPLRVQKQTPCSVLLCLLWPVADMAGYTRQTAIGQQLPLTQR
jgi:hypothetical protein